MAGRNQVKLEGVRKDIAAVNGAAKVPMALLLAGSSGFLCLRHVAATMLLQALLAAGHPRLGVSVETSASCKRKATRRPTLLNEAPYCSNLFRSKLP